MSAEEIQFILDAMEEQMEKAISHLEAELSKVRAGRATPQMLDGLFVDYYGVRTPLNNVSNVNTPDARTIVIQPWEKAMLPIIEKAIQAANLGFNPQNDGAIIRISVPPLTEERRKDLVKKAKAEAEHCKVTLRTSRKDANEEVKKLVKKGLPEDMGKGAEEKIQKLTDTYSAKADKHIEAKEKDIMTV
jgi:ribosome recycling factor